MADIRPGLSEIIARLQGDAAAAIPGVDVSLPRSLLVVLLRVFGGSIFEAWGHLQAIADDAIPDTATGAALERWAAMRSVYRIQGVKAIGTLSITAPVEWDPVGIGSRLVRADSVEYVTTSVPVNAGATWAALAAAVEPGADGSYVGPLSLVEPSAGVSGIAATMAGGVDRQSDEDLREDYLDILRAPPQGGTAADFKRWTEAVAGVTRAWVLAPVAGSPAFQIQVADDSVLPAAPIATPAAISAAQLAVDALKPVTAQPTVFGASFDALNAAITISPLNAELQAAVDAEIVALLDREAAPDKTISHAKLLAAIASTPGLVDFTLTSPAGDFVPAAGTVPYLGTTVYS